MNNQKIIIALDAMGGELAPDAVVQGATIALKKFLNLKFNIYGDKRKILSLLKNEKDYLDSINIIHTKNTISDEEKPTLAFRRSKKSSMFMAIKSVQDNECDAIVSSGNTGALMVISTLLIKTMKNIDRPAIASLFPTTKSETLMLDLGANINCTVKNIFDFAIMGNTYAKNVLGIQKPRVGLLNVGSEVLKGNELVQNAANKLRKYKNINFCGFVEGNDMPKGIVDVVVTDGFTGNIALKIAEGTADLYTDFLKSSFKDNFFSRLSYIVSYPIFKSLWNRVNPSKYNGAMLLGLNGIVVKSHGRSDKYGFANAIGVAHDLCLNKYNDKINNDIKKVS